MTFATLTTFACLTGVVVAACSSSSEATNDAASAELGAANYDKTCALCHGKNGEGYAADNATALNNPTFLATASDVFLRRSIARGRPGTTMSAWDRPHGGPYDDNAIAGIASYIRSWQTAPSVTLPTSSIVGDATHGATVYASTCASCHGGTGTEGPNVRLANAEFLAIASDAFLEYAIVHGRPGTAMKAFEGQLSAQDIHDVVALLRSWAKPVVNGDVPIPGSLGPIVLNADGPDPNFVVGNRFTPADTIKAEFDRGAAMGFLDARAPSDYVTSHIAGANDVPFYEASDYVFALPKDKWLVAYCGCPHAESGQLLDTLVANGFTKVTILDEGFFTWVSRGYPVRSGPNP
ncbi:Cytochrome c family protein [Labilithrix luteola]|uniref:Cytochrome c family protein n=1 Tax=Labilithrix luteola TaxID=1391654 RepID=A0A0K1Q485_9BACT|nr:Cytochrome c family protein [Labilithrix luteola]